MSQVSSENMHMDQKYGYMEKMSIEDTLAGNMIPWFNQTLCKVNDSSLFRVGVFKGEFPMHKHDDTDELFFVLEGTIIVEYENKSVVLTQHEGICIPKGVMHRPIASKAAKVLMVEKEGINPLGDL